MRVAYFVHDLRDPAVRRRVQMLRQGGADVTLLGFTRGTSAAPQIEGIVPIHLGYTKDARLGHRVMAVALAGLKCARTRTALHGADIVMARQLEMLVLAARSLRRYAPRARLVYECLDIHRLMLVAGLPGAILRAIEASLLRASQLLLVSSPAFVDEYFAKTHDARPPAYLVENKILDSELGSSAAPAGFRTGVCRPGPPWRIGWFGVIRCRRSLACLAALARQQAGAVDVIIRGRPARNVIPEFDQTVRDTPGLSFLGAYDRSKDLSTIYGDVHFTWAVDFYEAGRNSDWLLPNRLYEGCLMGTVPLADASVQTGRWLKAHGVDLLLEGPIEIALERLFQNLNQGLYSTAKRQIDRIPTKALLDDTASCEQFVRALMGYAEPT